MTLKVTRFVQLSRIKRRLRAVGQVREYTVFFQIICHQSSKEGTQSQFFSSKLSATYQWYMSYHYIPSKEPTPNPKVEIVPYQEHYQGGVGYQPTVGWQYQPTAHATNRTEPTQAGSNHARPSLCPISKTNPFSSSASNDRAPNLLMRSVFSGGHFPFLAEDYLFLSRLHSGTFFLLRMMEMVASYHS